MAEKQVGVRLSVIDGGKVKAELRSVGQEGAAALDKIRQAAEPASGGLKALNAAAQDINVRMSGFAGNAGVLGSALSALGPIGLAASVSVAALMAAFGKGLMDFAEAEKVTQRLNAVLEATGYAAGLTGDQLDVFADRMEASTMASAEGVNSAAAVLATFKSISGETFLRTIGLAQDLAATFGGDLSSSAVQLGKALEDPINGVSALARVGVTFSASQKEVIKSLVDTGRQAEAQKLILEVLAQQVGGAGENEARSLSGAFKRAGDAAGNFLEELVQITGVAPGTRSALDAIAEGLNKVTVNLLRAGSVGAQTGVAMKDLADAQKELQQAQELATNTGLKEDWDTVAAWEKRVADLRQKVEALAADARAADAQAQAAASGQVRAQADQATEVALAKLAEYRKALEGLATPEEKIQALRNGLNKVVDSLNALKEAGADPAAVEKAIATATEVARRSIAEIEKPGQEAAKKASKQTQDLISDLVSSINMFGNSRDEFVQKYIERIGEGASEAEIARVKQLANALYDKAEAEKAGKKAVDEHTKSIEDGKHVTDDVRTAIEKYVVRLSELQKLLKDGAISQETYARAAAKARKEMEDASTNGVDGMNRALRKYAEESGNSAKQLEEVVTSSFKGVEDAIVDLVTKGKADWSGLIDAMIADLIRLQLRTFVTGPLASALGSATSGLFGGGAGLTTGIFHDGGMVTGSPARQQQVPAALFAAAPRFHNGSPRLGSDEIPAILQVGERVLNRREAAAYGRGEGNDRPMQVVFNVSAPSPEAFRSSESQITAMLARTVARGRRGI